MNADPVFVTIRARDVKPYHYALCSSIEGGESFANCICSIKWSEDGTHLRWMLESHNFYEVEPDEEIEVVDLSGSRAWAWSQEKYSNWTLPPVPKRSTRYDHRYQWSPDGPECGLCGEQHEPNLEPETDA